MTTRRRVTGFGVGISWWAYLAIGICWVHATVSQAQAGHGEKVPSIHASNIDWESWSRQPGCRVKRLAGHRAGSSIDREDLRVRLLKLDSGAECGMPSREYTRLVFVLAGEPALDHPDPSGEGRLRLRPGTVVRIASGRAHLFQAGEFGASRLIAYAWAPHGLLETLHRGSTMVEGFEADTRTQARPNVRLKRYEPLAEGRPATRSWVHEEDVLWTTNWTYSERLWPVYRYKPLVRSAYADWDGIVQEDVRMGLQELDPWAAYPAHHHPSPEVYFVTEGVARWRIGSKEVDAGPGTLLYTPPGTVHRIQNVGGERLRWLYLWWAPDGDLSRFTQTGAGIQ